MKLQLGTIIIGLLVGTTVYGQAEVPSETEEARSVASAEILEVSTIIRPPFVQEQGPELVGFSIDLWDEIAYRNNWVHDYIIHSRFVDVLSAVKTPPQSDLAVANISITADREEIMDFSLPIYDSGLQIAISDLGVRPQFWWSLVSTHSLLIVGILTVIFLVVGLVIHQGAQQSDWKRSLPGSYWYLITFGQYGESLPVTLKNRLLFLFWMFSLVVGLVIITAEVTSNLVTEKQGSSITSYEQLAHRQVGVTAGSTSENFLRREGINVIPYDSFNRMMGHLREGQLDAVVHDAPILDYYVSHDPDGSIVTVGPVFNKEQYGIAFPTSSPLREPSNSTLLRMKEDGTYDQLYEKWFLQ